MRDRIRTARPRSIWPSGRAARRGGSVAAGAGALQRYPATSRRVASPGLRRCERGERLQRTLPARLSDQGQPAGRRGARDPALRSCGPGGRQQARADGGAGALAARRAGGLQRLQGSRVHPARADRATARVARADRDREAVRGAADPGGGRAARRGAPARRAGAAGRGGGGQLAEQRRREGQVRLWRPIRSWIWSARWSPPGGCTGSVCCMPIWARRSRIFRTSAPVSPSWCASMPSCAGSARRSPSWMSAAGWASTTRAPARATTARSTTASRVTRARSSRASRPSAADAACPSRICSANRVARMTAHHAVLDHQRDRSRGGRRPRRDAARPTRATPLLDALAGQLARRGRGAAAGGLCRRRASCSATARERFAQDRLDLTGRARAEELFFAICRRLAGRLDPAHPTPSRAGGRGQCTAGRQALLQLLACSSRCRTSGRSIRSFRSCRSSVSTSCRTHGRWCMT